MQRIGNAAKPAADERFQALIEQISLVTYTERVDAPGTFSYVSPQIEKVLGYAPGDVIGRPGFLLERVHPDDRARFVSEDERTNATGELFHLEYRIKSRSGAWLHVWDEALLARDAAGRPLHWQGVLVDITELRERVEQSRILLSSAQDAVIATDAQGSIIEFNAAAERMFTYRRDDVLGTPIVDLLIPSEQRIALEAAFNRYPEIEQDLPLGRHVQTAAIRADGARLPIELTVTRLEASRGPLYVAYVRDVSARIAAETALRASAERFRALVQNSYDVITVVNRDGSRGYISPSIEHLLGYAPDALLGGDVLGLVHPDDMATLREAIDACLQGAAQTPALEVRFRHQDGSWRDFETVGTNLLDEPEVDGIVFNSREITTRKATETALRESELRFRTAFDHAPIGLALVSITGQFTQVNKALCELLGYSEAELLRKTLQDMSYPEDLEDDLAVARRLFAGEIETYHLETRYMGKDGHIIWIELTVSAIQERDGRRSGIAQIQDVSGRRRLDMERATMLASEREYIKQLRDLAGMRKDLSQMVAHELRTPVASLRMMVSAVATGDMEPETEAEMFGAIHGQIDQLDRLVSDVVAAAAAERDDFSVQLLTVPLALLFSGATAFALGSLGDRRFTVGPAPDVQVWCDPERISQVLQNLLDNIARHTPPDTTVELRATRDDKRVHIEVADDGPGISEEDLQIIFEKFGRGRESWEGGTPGLGLGLYLSRQIVQAHGADLTVQSTPEHGTVFGFDVRVAQ